METLEIVDRFLEAYWAGDADAAADRVTEDFLWLNVPMPNMRIDGRDELVDLMRNRNGGFPEPIDAGEHVSVFGIADGDVALHERIDRFQLRGTWLEIPCNARWEVRDGKVALWKDYYDLGTYLAGMASVGITIDRAQWVTESGAAPPS